MQSMWLCLLPNNFGSQSLGVIWNRTVEKKQTNSTNVTLHPLGQSLLRLMWKCMDKYLMIYSIQLTEIKSLSSFMMMTMTMKQEAKTYRDRPFLVQILPKYRCNSCNCTLHDHVSYDDLVQWGKCWVLEAEFCKNNKFPIGNNLKNSRWFMSHSLTPFYYCATKIFQPTICGWLLATHHFHWQNTEGFDRQLQIQRKKEKTRQMLKYFWCYFRGHYVTYHFQQGIFQALASLNHVRL